MSGAGGPSRGVAQYLERYASPERLLAERFEETYQAALIVPAFCEEASLLEQYRAALEGAPGRVLVIVVVNAAAPVAAEHWPRHRRLIGELRGSRARQLSDAPPAWLAPYGGFDVLVIDRAHPRSCLPRGEGVGLARRIGCDLGLALYAGGRLLDPFLYCTDADAELPATYFHAGEDDGTTVARLFSFWHVPGGDRAIDEATALYELGLRYYVAGLAAAGSPYAFHALGSVMAVRAPSYAAVRGFPKRLAGEDFHLLDKLAKLGAIHRHDPRLIRLRARASLRTAHGTGVAAVKIARDPSSTAAPFYHPRVFELLRVWLAALEAYAQTRELSALAAALAGAGSDAQHRLEPALSALGAREAFESAAGQCRTEGALRARLHTWFDGLRTLKLLHALRDRGLPSLPWRLALDGAPWCCERELAQTASVDELRLLLLERHRELPALAGMGTFAR